MPVPRLILPLVSSVLLIASSGCSLRYDADDLRGQGAGALGDASLGSPGGDDDDPSGDADDGDSDAPDDDGSSGDAGSSDDGADDGSHGDGGPGDDGADGSDDDGTDGGADDGTDDGSDDGGGNPDAGTGNPPIDSGTSEPPIDAGVPPDCGGAEEECCLTEPECETWTQCTAGTCKVCGGKVEIVMRVPSVGKRHMARLCCEKAGKSGT